MRVLAPNRPWSDHLRKVVRKMRKLGAPTLRVVQVGDDYWAVEGSHRLAASELLGLQPVFVVMKEPFRTSQGYGTRLALVCSKIDCEVSPEEFVANLRAAYGDDVGSPDDDWYVF